MLLCFGTIGTIYRTCDNESISINVSLLCYDCIVESSKYRCIFENYVSFYYL